MEFLLIVWIFCGIGATVVASGRGANGCLWFGLGFIFGPFGLAASFMAGENVVCLSCRKRIHPDAEKCPYCQTTLNKQPQPSTSRVVLGKVCSKCGFRNDADWKFCERCSAQINPDGDPDMQPALPSVSPSPNLTVQFERLAELRSKGLLSAEEFQRAKAKLLE